MLTGIPFPSRDFIYNLMPMNIARELSETIVDRIRVQRKTFRMEM